MEGGFPVRELGTVGRRHLVLVGLMGAGKSEVGRRCAERLHRAFLDTDELVEAAASASVAEIFSSQGEAGFRALERRAVGDACRSPEPAVVACGGGAVLDEENRRLLGEHGFVVWLDAPPDVLAERLGDGSGRPLLAGGTRPALHRLAAVREPAYRGVADAVVGTADLGAEEVAEAVLDAFRATGVEP